MVVAPASPVPTLTSLPSWMKVPTGVNTAAVPDNAASVPGLAALSSNSLTEILRSVTVIPISAAMVKTESLVTPCRNDESKPLVIISLPSISKKLAAPVSWTSPFGQNKI